MMHRVPLLTAPYGPIRIHISLHQYYCKKALRPFKPRADRAKLAMLQGDQMSPPPITQQCSNPAPYERTARLCVNMSRLIQQCFSSCSRRWSNVATTTLMFAIRGHIAWSILCYWPYLHVLLAIVTTLLVLICGAQLATMLNVQRVC
eukprot:5152239-Amphidinium_carterae.1